MYHPWKFHFFWWRDLNSCSIGLTSAITADNEERISASSLLTFAKEDFRLSTWTRYCRQTHPVWSMIETKLANTSLGRPVHCWWYKWLHTSHLMLSVFKVVVSLQKNELFLIIRLYFITFSTAIIINGSFVIIVIISSFINVSTGSKASSVRTFCSHTITLALYAWLFPIVSNSVAWGHIDNVAPSWRRHRKA